MTQQAGTQPPATNEISLGAWLTLPLVFVLGGVLTLANLALAGLVSGGPDSCAEASCSGSPLFAKIFLAIALVPATATIATVFTLRPARFMIRCALIATALVAPILADAVALSASPDWFW
ncbi:hypothetical protein [Actinomadura bangladeshensis]|uniref:Uncharacterized protein n=1 Tax=Actinomadura bangladeshensis TaxID=453573 RepID=A0A4R4NVX7_9ACTN|nr:hypothetical protein [Actinomadura bangladeshensis]TDC12263.1 hypothetical protein E1284_24240 [Actinomadura bangladeshensis]